MIFRRRLRRSFSRRFSGMFRREIQKEEIHKEI
jgi:hypothetical protein